MRAWLAIFLFLGSAAVQAASAQETRFIFATLSPAGGAQAAGFLHPWAQRINDQGKGVLNIDIRDGTALANFSNVYDRVRNDVVQLGWALHGAIGGRFSRTEVASLPFLVDNGEAASVALWRLYKTGLLDEEYRDVVPLVFGVFGQFQIHFARPIPTTENLRGLKVAATTKVQLESVSRLGATPLSIPAQDIYEALQRRTIDGTMIAWSAFNSFKLGEVTSYHVEIPLGATTTMLFMTRSRYNALSPAARKVVDDNSGEAISRQFGAHQDRLWKEQRALATKEGKRTVVHLSPEQDGQWRQTVAPVIDEWAKSRPNGKKILETYRGILAEVQKR
ncbi:MAG: TRAP transporter substrate-binding protein [Xanthobacteraceae bacterium]